MAKEKKFIEVEIPLLTHKVELLGNKVEDLNNRTIKMDLTRMLKGKNVEAIFKIDVKDGKADIYPIRLHIFGFFIRRIIRKSIDYVEESFVVETSNAQVRIKPFLITRKKVSRIVRNVLRVKVKEECTEYMKDKKYEDLMLDLLSGKFQKTLSLKLKKIYPLAFCDIRDFELVKRK